MQKLKKHWLLTVTAFILILGAIIIYNLPFKLAYEMNALEVKYDDPTFLEEVKVAVVGDYSFNLFSPDTFDGQIIISNDQLTSKRMRSIQFKSWSKRYLDGLFYYPEDEPENPHVSYLPPIYLFGNIDCNWMMNDMIIYINEKAAEEYSEKDSTTLVMNFDHGDAIVTKVTTRQAAIDRLKLSPYVNKDIIVEPAKEQ